MSKTRMISLGLTVVALVALGAAAPAFAQDCDRYDHGGLRPPTDPSPDVACGGPGFVRPPETNLGVGSLTTLFASNNGFAGNTFDVTVTAPLTITSFDVNLEASANETITVYWRLGTSVGNENTPGAWTLLGSDSTVVGAGTDIPSPVAVGGLTLMPAQTYGFYIDQTSYNGGPATVYTNGGPTLYSNADMSITTNTGQAAPAFSGSFFPRQWNGTIYYDLGGDADLDLTKTADPDPVAPGGTLTYTLTVTNNGPDDAPNTVVTDTLPAEFSYTGDDCGGGVAGGPPGGTFTWMIGTLANGASAVCNVSGTVDPASPTGTSITNAATATSDATDPTPPTAAASVTVQQSILEIPTLSQIGLVLLLVLLAGIAVWRIRRAQHA